MSMVWPTLGSRTAKEQEQLAFGEDMDRSIVSCFFDSQCIMTPLQQPIALPS